MARRTAVGLERSSPMSATTTRPAWKRPGATARPTFGAWNVTVRSALTAAPAISPVDASTPDGTSTETTGAPGGVDPLDQLARPPGAAHRGTRCRRARRRSRRSRSTSVVSSATRPASRRTRAATRPSPPFEPPPQTHGEAPRGGEREHRLARDRRSRALHQLGDRRRVARVALLGRAHLGGRVERLEALSHRRAGDDAIAAAISRECVIERSIAPAPTRSAKAAVRPESRTPGFGRPTISISFHVKRARRSRAPCRRPPCRRSAPRSSPPGSRARVAVRALGLA